MPRSTSAEWALALSIFNSSLILTINPQLFDGGPIYAGLAALASEFEWSIGLAVVGGWRLLILAVNGALRRSPHYCMAGAFVSSFVWFLLTLGLVRAETIGLGLAIFPVLLFLDSFNVIRAAIEAAHSDRLHARMATHVAAQHPL